MPRHPLLLGLVLLAVLITAGPATAQSYPSSADTVRVGDGVIDGSFITPYTITWTSTTTTPDGTTNPGNTTKEVVEYVDAEAGRLLKFAQSWYNPDGDLLYVNTQVADPQTLAQKKFHSLAPQGGIGHLDFEETRIHGAAAYAAEAEHLVFDIALDEPLFADGLAGLFVAAFPLAEGYAVTVPGFGWGGSCAEPCLAWMDYRVTGREQVAVPEHGLLDTWVVEVGAPGSGLHYWVTDQAPYFVKAVAKGANGGITTFEVLTWARLDDQ